LEDNGTKRMRLFPVASETMPDRVPQLSQLVVTEKFMVTEAEMVGLIRFKSIGRLDPLPLAYRKVTVRLCAVVEFKAKVIPAVLLLFKSTKPVPVYPI